ncbi:MAG: cation-translocating P-type ATPase [Zavarzinella sp.]
MPTNPLRGRPGKNGAAAQYCCYGCLSIGEQLASNSTDFKQSPHIVRTLAFRIAISILVIAQSMIFSVAINLEPSTPLNIRLYIQIISAVGAAVVFVLLGFPLLRAACGSILQRNFSLELLFLVTMLGAAGVSIHGMTTPGGAVYFEVIPTLLVVYTLGKAITAHSRAKAIASSQRWYHQLNSARTIIDENILIKSASDLPVGSIVEVRAGEHFPADGIITHGTGDVVEAALTGEPYWKAKIPGSEVMAGSISVDATFQVRSTVAGNARQVDRIMQLVEQARSIPGASQQLADRLGSILFPILLLAAGGTFIYWWQTNSLATGLYHALAVLLIACPCALGLATPLVIWHAIGQLVTQGIVVHRGDVIEKLAAIDCVVFDKTGTLTDDEFRIVASCFDLPAEKIVHFQELVAAVQRHSTHPMAPAFASWLPTEKEIAVKHCQTVPGWGIQAEIRWDNSPGLLQIGRAEWFDPPTIPISWHQKQQESGKEVHFWLAGCWVGAVLITEQLRSHSREALAELHLAGYRTVVLSGDTTAHLDRYQFSEAYGDQLPEQKAIFLKNLQEDGWHPLFVGDGTNDGPALATADVGVALASGTDLANNIADISLYRKDLRLISWLLQLSQSATRLIRQNLFIAATYNAVGVGLAMAGYLHPVVAAMIMVVSSLMITWNSTRVSVDPDRMLHCQRPVRDRPPARIMLLLQSGCHFLAWISVLVIVGKMSGFPISAQFVLLFGGGIIGLMLTYWWFHHENISPSLDMAFGMLTWGNLGMTFGWWYDQKFQVPAEICHCSWNLAQLWNQPGMWLGMILACNLAMILLPRRSHWSVPFCAWSMFTGGNLGMVLGMIAGSQVVQLFHPTPTWAVLADFLGMAIGMHLGMALATEAQRFMMLQVWRYRRKRDYRRQFS